MAEAKKEKGHTMSNCWTCLEEMEDCKCAPGEPQPPKAQEISVPVTLLVDILDRISAKDEVIDTMMAGGAAAEQMRKEWFEIKELEKRGEAK